MSDSNSQSGKPAVDDRRSDPAMQKLFQMSRTAGVGMANYAAVNVPTVVAAIAGGASVFAILFRELPILLCIPVLAILLGVIGVIQVRQSNGTQTGAILGAAGALIGVLILGAILVLNVRVRSEDARFNQQIDQLVESFGKHIFDGNDEQAYQLLDPRLQDRVKLETFKRQMDMVIRGIGAYRAKPTAISMRDRMEILRDAEGNVNAQGILMVELNVKVPGRDEYAKAQEPIDFTLFGEDQWKISNIRSWFPLELDDRKTTTPGSR
jgi:hypothetical protein